MLWYKNALTAQGRSVAFVQDSRPVPGDVVVAGEQPNKTALEQAYDVVLAEQSGALNIYRITGVKDTAGHSR